MDWPGYLELVVTFITFSGNLNWNRKQSLYESRTGVKCEICDG